METQTEQRTMIELNDAEYECLNVVMRENEGYNYKPPFDIFESMPLPNKIIMDIHQLDKCTQALSTWLSFEAPIACSHNVKIARELYEKFSDAGLELSLKSDMSTQPAKDRKLTPDERERLVSSMLVAFLMFCIIPGDENDSYMVTPTKRKYMHHMWQELKFTRGEVYQVFNKYGRGENPEGTPAIGVSFGEYADQIWQLLEEVELI